MMPGLPEPDANPAAGPEDDPDADPAAAVDAEPRFALDGDSNSWPWITRPSAALKVTGLGVTSCATGKSAGSVPAASAERWLPSRLTVDTTGGCCALADTKAIMRSLATTGCHSNVSPDVRA